MKKLKLKATVIILIILSLILTQIIMGQFKGKERKIVFDRNTVYYRLIVFDKKSYRYLVFGTKVYQTIMDKNKPYKVLFEYARLMLSTLYLQKNLKRTLLLGLGGGSMVKYIKRHFPDTYLDIAEIDPMVIKVAKKYFNTPVAGKIKAYAYDGRIFIKRVKHKYDVIMLDAFNSEYIPFHLMTQEYFKEIKKKLAPGGIVLQNIWTNNDLMKRIMSTFKSEFKYVYFAKGVSTSNAVVLASNRKVDFSRSNIMQAYRKFKNHGINYNFHFLKNLRRFDLYKGGARQSLVLTDEHAPVNYYHSQK